MPANFDSPAFSTSVSPTANPGGTASAELPNLPSKTPSLINPNSRCDELGTPTPAKIVGPAEVYVNSVNTNATVKGPGGVTLDSPASGNPVKYGG